MDGARGDKKQGRQVDGDHKNAVKKKKKKSSQFGKLVQSLRSPS